MESNPETKERRREELYQAWLRHIEETPKHPRPGAGGVISAHYDMNVAASYIECCTPGCHWTRRESVELEEITA